VPNVHTHTFGDRYRITVTAGVVTYDVIDINDNVTLLHTSTNTSTGTIFTKIVFGSQTCLVNCIINYELPGYIMVAGDSIAETGVENVHFRAIDGYRPEYVDFQIDGSEAVVHITDPDDATYDLMTVPGPGEVTLNPVTGWIVCNPADVGRALTGSIIVIYDQI